MRIFIYIFISLCSLFSFSAQAASFLALADLHFDPYAACQSQAPCPLIQQLTVSPISKWDILLKASPAQPLSSGHDTDYALWQTTLTELDQRVKQTHPTFILLLGDLLAHDYQEKYVALTGQNNAANYRQFARKTFHYLTQTLAKRFPETNLYAVLGNNDTYAKHFDLTTQTAVTRDLGNSLSANIHSSASRLSFKKQFNHYGCYSVLLPGTHHLRLIALNSTPFARQAIKNVAMQRAELRFLHTNLQLAARQHEKALIVMHIPNNVDVYTSLKKSLVLQWQEDISQQFNRELTAHAASIVGVLAAHIHSDWFSHFKSIPMIGVNSISPQHNLPGYKLIQFDSTTNTLIDYQTWYYRNNQWQLGYDFNQEYSTRTLNAISALQAREIAPSFVKYFEKDRIPNPISTENWPYYACNFAYTSLADYKKCLTNHSG